MMFATLVLSAAMAGQPQVNAPAKTAQGPAKAQLHSPTKSVGAELHSMTEEEKRVYPGRERFDKTEWYESSFKSSRVVLAPEHVDEWKNGGIETT
jgi:hypothetical protein